MADQTPTFFDQKCASGYDQQWSKLAPLRDSLHRFISAILAELPDNARILCVGVGTGSELLFLAQRFPNWRFTAVEPSAPMLEVCRRKVEEQGLMARCDWHLGYLDSLPATEPYDAATALLVSHFITERAARLRFFHTIAHRLRPNGYLINADLATDTQAESYPTMLEVWLRLMSGAAVTPEAIERMRSTYGRDVALLPPNDVSTIITTSGFNTPVPFLQHGLIHAWFARRRNGTMASVD